MRNGKITYIDFWASWCGPCKSEMPLSKKLKLQYHQKDINFVYISIDDNFVSWEKATKLLELENSYFLKGGIKSKIAKENNITSIPRYMILDQKGKIIYSDAPRPSNPKLIDIFESLLSKK